MKTLRMTSMRRRYKLPMNAIGKSSHPLLPRAHVVIRRKGSAYVVRLMIQRHYGNAWEWHAVHRAKTYAEARAARNDLETHAEALGIPRSHIERD